MGGVKGMSGLRDFLAALRGRHVRRDLSAFCHGALSAERARLVAAHLERCARCRSAADDIRFGVEMASHLERLTAPENLWRQVEARLDAPARAPARAAGRVRPRRLAVAAALVLTAAAGLWVWHAWFRDRLEIVAVAAPPSAFEEAARDAHMRRLDGRLAFDYATTSPASLRQWIQEHAGLSLSLALSRPPEDAGRFQVFGATMVQAGGARAVVVGYEIDAHPVTLVSASLADVRDPPPDIRFGKKIAYRIDAERGVTLLSWGADGQAYVLVSSLPGRGTEACGICHTTPERRRLIRDAPLRTGV